MNGLKLKKTTQGRDSVPVVLIAPDQTRYDRTFQDTELRCLWNDISQDSDIPKMAEIQGNRSNIYIDLDSLPALSGTTRIKPVRGWLVEGRPNPYFDIATYQIEGTDPDNQLPGIIMHLAKTKVIV